MIFTKAIREKLMRNAEATEKMRNETGGDTPEHVPVIKVFNPYGPNTWLFTELWPDGRLFGLCDHGMGEPELGYELLSNIETLRMAPFPGGPKILKLERDQHFRTKRPLIAFARAAWELGRIPTDAELAGQVGRYH